MLKTNLTTALACALLTTAAPGSAQENFPSKPIRMLVPFSAGSATDFCRAPARRENDRALGAAGRGRQPAERRRHHRVRDAARGTADGYTLMLVSIGHAVNASLYTKLPYDTVKDFAGITLVADTPTVLVVTPSLGLKTVKDLVDLPSRKPGQINYASAGVGSGAHMNAEQFKLATGIDVVHVPFKGTPEALTNTIGGSVSYFFSPITGAVTLVKGGKITALAVSTKERSPVLPDLPSATEVGVPGSSSICGRDCWARRRCRKT